jgi:hypothetical protein
MNYQILVRYYNQEGINDGKYFEVIDEHFNLISRHKSHKLAEKKIKELMKINNIGELELFNKGQLNNYLGLK